MASELGDRVWSHNMDNGNFDYTDVQPVTISPAEQVTTASTKLMRIMEYLLAFGQQPSLPAGPASRRELDKEL